MDRQDVYKTGLHHESPGLFMSGFARCFTLLIFRPSCLMDGLDSDVYGMSMDRLLTWVVSEGLGLSVVSINQIFLPYVSVMSWAFT